MRISDWSSDVCSSDLLAAALARALGAIPVSVSIARSAEADGVPLIEAGYPRVSIPWHDARVRKELVFAVIREESGFVQEAVSPAAAVGLMQVTRVADDHSGQKARARGDFPTERGDARYNHPSCTPHPGLTNIDSGADEEYSWTTG